MALLISHSTGTGKTLAVTLERLSDGAEWRQAATAGWEASGTSTFANRKVAMTEGTAEKAGSYTCSVTGLGNAADVRVRVHNDGDADQVIGIGEVYVWGGNEIPAATDSSGADLATAAMFNSDANSEPGQGAPAANATIFQKIGYLYKAWRNRSTQADGTGGYKVYGDDATTVHHKANVSDNGTVFDRGEIETGP